MTRSPPEPTLSLRITPERELEQGWHFEVSVLKILLWGISLGELENVL